MSYNHNPRTRLTQAKIPEGTMLERLEAWIKYQRDCTIGNDSWYVRELLLLVDDYKKAQAKKGLDCGP